MKKLLLLFFFGTMAYAQPNIMPPDNQFACETIPGSATFDLTANNSVVLAGLNPGSFTVTYYQTMAEAGAGMGAIANPTAYVSMAATVFVRVTEIANSTNYNVASFQLMVIPTPADVELPAIEHCPGPVDLTVNENLIDSNNNISYFESMMEAQANFNTIAFPQSYIAESSSTVWVRVENNSGCYRILEQELILNGNIEIAGVMTEAQTVTIVMASEGDYQYSLDEGEWQSDPNFYNIPYGPHLGLVQDVLCGSVMAITFDVTPLTPTGQPEQTVTEGATLADLEVEGENILWYDNDGAMPDFPDGMDEPLPLTTVLTDGTTYYASQTIDGVESAQRFGVTVNLVLGLNDTVFNSLNCYPNPTVGIITIDNTNGIDIITVTNALGQKVFSKAINNNKAQVDVSSLNKGVYFVTVTSGSAAKTIKVIKE